MNETILVGTRGSLLARIQAELVVDELARAGWPTRIIVVETDGDRRAPDTTWGTGAFVAAIEQALLDGRVDVAVHSAKDVPTAMDPRLRIGAYLSRADPRDALVVRADSGARQIDDLPTGSRVGTDSPRRTGFLRACRPDLEVHPLHGNVDTRLRRLDEHETDALVLACAGLDRLGRGDRIAQRIDPTVIPPAPGQGAIAVQVRTHDDRVSPLLAAIDHHETRVAVEAERAFLAASGGGCRSPIGALATVAPDGLRLLGGYASVTGSAAVTLERSGPRGSGPSIAAELALALAQAGRRVLVTRAAEQADGLVEALLQEALVPVVVPAIEIELEPSDDLDGRVANLPRGTWITVTSANGARAVAGSIVRIGWNPAGGRWAAIGEATAETLEASGIDVAFRPSDPAAESIGSELPIGVGEHVLVVRGDLAGTSLADALRGRGASVDDVIAYRTIEAPETSRILLRDAFADGPIAAIVLTSGSSARGLASLAHLEEVLLTTIPAICVGPRTARAAEAAGFKVAAIAAAPRVTELATAVASLVRATPRSNPAPVETRR